MCWIFLVKLSCILWNFGQFNWAQLSLSYTLLGTVNEVAVDACFAVSTVCMCHRLMAVRPLLSWCNYWLETMSVSRKQCWQRPWRRARSSRRWPSHQELLSWQKSRTHWLTTSAKGWWTRNLLIFTMNCQALQFRYSAVRTGDLQRFRINRGLESGCMCIHRSQCQQRVLAEVPGIILFVCKHSVLFLEFCSFSSINTLWSVPWAY